MALVVRAPAEALLSNGKEAAVFDRTGAEITQQQDCVHKDNGYVTLGQVVLDVLNGYCAVRKKNRHLVKEAGVNKVPGGAQCSWHFTDIL